MRFKNITIKEAGPLKDISIRFKDVNLIIGNNEDGKTTLIDIMIQNLFQKKNPFSRPFWDERFNFDDMVAVETEGEELQDELQKMSSLLVVREGKNQWRGKSLKNDLLSTGLWNEDIKEIIYGSDAIYSRINKNLGKCLGIIKSDSWLRVFNKNLLEFQAVIDAEMNRLEELKNNESFIAKNSCEQKEIDAGIFNMTESRKTSDLQNGRELIEDFFKKTDDSDKLRTDIEKLEKKELSKIQIEWDFIKKETVIIEKKIEEIKSSLNSDERLKNEKSNQIIELEKEIVDISNKLSELEVEKSKAAAQKEVKEKYFLEKKRNITGFGYEKPFIIAGIIALISGISAGLLGIAQTLNFIKLPIGYIPLLIAGSITSAAGLILIFTGIGKKQKNRQASESINEELKRLNEDYNMTFNNIRDQIKILNNQKNKISEKIKLIQNDALKLCGTDLCLERDKLLKKLDENKEKDINLTKIYFSYDDVIKEQEKLSNMKQNLFKKEKEIEDIKLKLQGRFKSDSPAHLREELEKIRNNIPDKEPVHNYNEALFNKLIEKKDEIISQISKRMQENEKIRGEISTKISEGLKSLQNGVNPEYLELFYSEIHSFRLANDIFNLYAFKEMLRIFIEKVQDDICLSEILQSSFQNIQSRLETLINGVFKVDFFKYTLSKITNGAYKDIDFLVKGNEIVLNLINKDGVSYEFSKLSTGMRNQLYFAVRLALARERFGDKKGVFILDDAFITFDEGRRKSSLELLKEYASAGWQIVYASVDEKGMERLFEEVFGNKLNKVLLKVSSA